jgi:hypothetical protein
MCGIIKFYAFRLTFLKKVLIIIVIAANASVLMSYTANGPYKTYYICVVFMVPQIILYANHESACLNVIKK